MFLILNIILQYVFYLVFYLWPWLWYKKIDKKALNVAKMVLDTALKRPSEKTSGVL